jgi:prevent-host-death family protein
MDVYTYSEARQHLSKVLDRAKKAGAVRIRRRGGTVFQITPVEQRASPFDVGFVEVKLTREDIVSAVRESRAEK